MRISAVTRYTFGGRAGCPKTRPLVQDTTVGFGLITYCIEDRTGVYRKA